MNLTTEQLERLTRLRQRTYDLVRARLIEDGHCKSYEGAWQLTANWPSYFDADKLGPGDDDIPPNESYRKARAALRPASWTLTLHCYVLGPSRHYQWHADTIDEVLAKGEAAIASEERGEDRLDLWEHYPNYWCGRCDIQH